ncbi:MAG: D-alanyl-D-alanine carboxypeptidase [Ruminococcaceae bacterium]|nr:D-alanyl-D-alanine carboxypeptidase [Oscillospiraceae bacterium]
MKRFFAGTAVVLAAVLFLTIPVGAISAQKAILVDAQTGRVLYEKAADSRSLIASTTKIMTALLVCEQCNVLDRMKIPKEAVGIEGSSMYLQEGEVLSLQELLYGLMLRSGNDAAVALAIYCGGTVEGFVAMMNDKARLLGLEGTHFQNPNGLDGPNHYSTARDLAKLTAYAMRNPIFYQTVSTKSVRVGNRTMQNHNKLLWRVDGADGVKTGYTKAAGRILVSSATRDGRRLICVTINDGDDWKDHSTLLEKGFSGYTVQSIIRSGEHLGEITVFSGSKEKVSLIATKDFSYPLSADERAQIVISGPGFAYAPVVKGKEAGYAYVCIGDVAVGRVKLIYSETIERIVQKEKPGFWERLFGGGK